MNLAEEFARLHEAWNSAGVAEAPRARHAFAVFCHENAESLIAGLRAYETRELKLTYSFPDGLSSPHYATDDAFDVDLAISVLETLAKRIETEGKKYPGQTIEFQTKSMADGVRLSIDSILELERVTKKLLVSEIHTAIGADLDKIMEPYGETFRRKVVDDGRQADYTTGLPLESDAEYRARILATGVLT